MKYDEHRVRTKLKLHILLSHCLRRPIYLAALLVQFRLPSSRHTSRYCFNYRAVFICNLGRQSSLAHSHAQIYSTFIIHHRPSCTLVRIQKQSHRSKSDRPAIYPILIALCSSIFTYINAPPLPLPLPGLSSSPGGGGGGNALPVPFPLASQFFRC